MARSPHGSSRRVSQERGGSGRSTVQIRISRLLATDSRASRSVSSRWPEKGQYKKNTEPPASDPVSARRHEVARTLHERAFVFMTLADDRNLAAAYVGGMARYTRD